MHPLPEYPRPSMRRDSYVNLNGPWDYAITQSSEFPAKWDGAILVPYSPEAKASGVGRTLQPGQWLHYHRTFTPPAGEGGRVLLHFGAVAAGEDGGVAVGAALPGDEAQQQALVHPHRLRGCQILCHQNAGLRALQGGIVHALQDVQHGLGNVDDIGAAGL